MKSGIIFSFAVALALCGSFSSFGSERNAATTVSLSRAIANNSDKAFQEYALLQKALANDNADDAQKAAANLVKALKDIPKSATAAKVAVAISKTNDIKAQRKSFASLSTALENLFKANKPEDVMIYIHYCPMAKVSWLSNSKDIQNPYLGKSMPTCGETTGMIM